MSNRKRTAVIFFIAGLFLGTPAMVFPKTALVAIRHWTAPDHTRIVLDLSERARYKERFLQEPLGISIELENTDAPPGQKGKNIEDGLVRGVGVNTLPGNLLQVVIGLERESGYKVFSLPKAGSMPERVVIDVARAVPPARKKEEQTAIISLKRKRVKIVVVDPGHGGEDPGAIGWGRLREKDVCFDLARKTVDEINNIPGHKAYLTRTGDYFLPLRKRTAMARERQADVFVSIHANASKAGPARGTEIYFLSLTGATDEAARELARMENAADLVGGVPEEANDDLVSILYDLRQSDTLRRSSGLAESVVDNMKAHARPVTRGVRQAGFTVLKSPAIPSILVETAFITDKKESKLLRDAGFQNEFARLLASGIAGYFKRFGPEASRPATHVVQKGESLKDISDAYGVSMQDLRNYNNLTDRASISAGQEIIILP